MLRRKKKGGYTASCGRFFVWSERVYYVSMAEYEKLPDFKVKKVLLQGIRFYAVFLLLCGLIVAIVYVFLRTAQ